MHVEWTMYRIYIYVCLQDIYLSGMDDMFVLNSNIIYNVWARGCFTVIGLVALI